MRCGVTLGSVKVTEDIHVGIAASNSMTFENPHLSSLGLDLQPVQHVVILQFREVLCVVLTSQLRHDRRLFIAHQVPVHSLEPRMVSDLTSTMSGTKAFLGVRSQKMFDQVFAMLADRWRIRELHLTIEDVTKCFIPRATSEWSGPKQHLKEKDSIGPPID